LFVMLAGAFVGIVFVLFVRFTVLVVFIVRRLVVFEIDMVAESGDMQRVFMRGIGFGFRGGLRRANGLPGFGFVRFMFAGLVFLVVEFGDVLCFGLGLFTAGFGGLCAGSCEKPAGKGTTRAAWARRGAGNDCATARLNVLRDVRLRFVDVFLDRSNGCGGYRA